MLFKLLELCRDFAQKAGVALFFQGKKLLNTPAGAAIAGGTAASIVTYLLSKSSTEKRLSEAEDSNRNLQKELSQEKQLVRRFRERNDDYNERLIELNRKIYKSKFLEQECRSYVNYLTTAYNSAWCWGRPKKPPYEFKAENHSLKKPKI